jgi:phosphatidylethanolamine-binding protein (PEBP) family uncharacterized protein
MRRTLVVALALALAAAAGCAPVDTSKLPRMGVDFAFEGRHKCQGVSPEIRLTGVPDGVASYEVTMTDLDVPTFHHWAQKIAAAGPVIKEGAGSGYFGPCPPSGTHRYRIEVTALDGRGQPVAYGEKTVTAGR